MSGLFFFCTQYSYWGSVFGVQALKGNIYFNSFVGVGGDFCGNVLVEYALKHYRRKTIFRASFLIILLCAIGFVVVEVPEECIIVSGTWCW